jgi:PAS domain S-box-containing protein
MIEEWEHFFTLSLDLMCIAGFDGYFKHLNSAWENVLGFSHEELLAQPFIQFVHPEDRAATLIELERLTAGTDTINFENRCLCQDGSYKWLLWRSKTSLDKQLIYAIGRDVTVQKHEIAVHQSEQAATAEVEELVKLNRLKDEFLSTVSHELRTPLSNMKVAVQMLAITLNQQMSLFSEMAKPIAERSRIARYFQILQDECEREISLIDDLLDLQRLDAGVQPLVLETIDLESWLLQVLEPFQVQIRDRQQTLELDLAPSLPPLVSDLYSLERLLKELLNNASKYTPSGEHITLRAFVQSQTIQLQVINSGCRNSGCGVTPNF